MTRKIALGSGTPYSMVVVVCGEIEVDDEGYIVAVTPDPTARYRVTEHQRGEQKMIAVESPGYDAIRESRARDG